MCDFNSDSGAFAGKPHQVTDISTGADGGIWSPDGKNIVFVSAVYPDCKDDTCNKQRDEELKKSKVKAKIFTRLFYRHWNAFTEFKRSHLFVVSADANLTGLNGQVSGTQNVSSGNEPRDLTRGDHDVPPFHLGGQDMYANSPDGQERAYTSNIDEVEATSTNNEIFIVPMTVESAVPSGKSPDALRTAHATAQPTKISTSPGSDSTPLYSPDGKYLAWRSQARAGYESDKQSLIVYERASGKLSDVTKDFPLSVGSFLWASDDKPPTPDKPEGLMFTAEHQGEAPIYLLLLLPGEEPRNLAEIHADELSLGPSGTYFTCMSIQAPNEIYKFGGPVSR